MAPATLISAEEGLLDSEKYENQDGIEGDFAYNNNVADADIRIRMGFLRKVYGLLTIQLLMTVAIAAVFMMTESMKLFVMDNPWTVILTLFMTFGILIALHFKRKDHPTNLVLLCALTVFQAYTIGFIVSMYEARLVVEALFITLTVVVGLTAFAFQTKKDFSFLGIGLSVGLWVLIIGGFLQIFIQSTVLELILSISGALLFSVFIVFDTHLIMRTLSPEEYILATINLYLDIINLFLYILRILAATRE